MKKPSARKVKDAAVNLQQLLSDNNSSIEINITSGNITMCSRVTGDNTLNVKVNNIPKTVNAIKYLQECKDGSPISGYNFLSWNSR